MIGHEWARALLARAAQRRRLGHAYLISGPDSVGKTALALHLGAMLVCTGPEPQPCGVCRGCRLLAHGGHPDVRVIERAENRRDITIEQVRQIEDDIGLAPFEAPRKLFCMGGADTLNDAGASALLKTLEEPPAHAVIVLCAADPQSLPLTIRSRCQHLALQPVPAATTAAGLTTHYGASPERAAELAKLARGRPGWAVQALQQPALIETARAAQDAIAGLAGSGPFSRLVAVGNWLGAGKDTSFNQSRERALAFLTILEGWWRDALLVSLEDAAPALRAHVLSDGQRTSLQPSDIVLYLGRIQQASARVEANVAPRLVLEQLIGEMPGIQGGTRRG